MAFLAITLNIINISLTLPKHAPRAFAKKVLAVGENPYTMLFYIYPTLLYFKNHIRKVKNDRKNRPHRHSGKIA